jgi:uncharacterized RDD family membrane protein YckC
MAQELLILSPEKTVVSVDIARIGSRVFAQLLDVLLIVVGLVIIFVVCAAISTAAALSGVPSNSALGPIVFAVTLGWLIYFILFEGLWNGQTIGKKALGIRVRMTDGTPVTFLAAVSRNLLRPADILPFYYLLGLLAMFSNVKSQRLGDMVAGTIVVRERRPMPIFSPAPYSLGVHAFEDQVGPLRGMTSDEYVVLRRLCDRFPELAARVQDQLIEEVWWPFAERMKIAPIDNVHPVYLAEAVVMKYGRRHGLL